MTKNKNMHTGKFSNKDADSFAIKKTREVRRKTRDVFSCKVPINW